MPSQLHDYRSVNTRFPGIAYEGMPQIVEPEILYPCLFESICKSDLDALDGLPMIGKNILVGDMSYLAQPFQNASHRAVKIDIPWLAGFRMLGG